MFSVWSTLLAVGAAQASVAPCGEVTVVKNRCSEDGTGYVQFKFDIPNLPDDLPVRSAEISVLRWSSSGDEVVKARNFYTDFDARYGDAELEAPIGWVKGTVSGPCGETADFVDVLYYAEKVEEVSMDVKGRVSEAASWLEGEAAAGTHGAHLYMDLQSGEQALTIKWAGRSVNKVHMTVFKDPLPGEDTEPTPVEGGQWTFGGFSGVRTLEYRAKKGTEPLNDPLVRVQLLKLKPIEGVCRLEKLTITSEVDK